MYDIEGLMEAADSKTVADYIGMETFYRSGRYFIYCPGHMNRLGKPDRNIGSCILTPKGYHCYACGQNVGLISMVMEFTGCGYKQALETIGDSCGGASMFRDFDTNSKTKKFPLSPEDLAIIGLQPYGTRNLRTAVALADEGTTTDKSFVDKANGEFLVYEKVENISLEMLFQSDEKAFKELIHSKATEAVSRYETAITNFCSRTSPQIMKAYDILSDDDGNLDSADLVKLKNVFQKRLWRAKEIEEENRS